MKIILCEYELKGHCIVYLNSLLKIKGTEKKVIETKLANIYQIYYYFKTRRKLLEKFFKENDKQKKVYHILYGDTFFNLPLLFKLNNKNKVIFTLHHVPKSLLKHLLIKNFSKQADKIIVHSKFLKDELNKLDIKNVSVINYPSFYDYDGIYREKIRKSLNINKNKIILSCLGGTRKSKGLNILLESIKYLSLKNKEKILINIAGEEAFFKKDYVKKYTKDIEVRMNLKLLSDKEFQENVIMTDIMVMPYLKSFGGNSGPMTEAIVNKIPCITPAELNIGKINLENNLGEVFECENPKSLAEAIERTIGNLGKNKYYTTDFYKTLTEENFLRSYEKIYKELWSELENE